MPLQKQLYCLLVGVEPIDVSLGLDDLHTRGTHAGGGDLDAERFGDVVADRWPAAMTRAERRGVDLEPRLGESRAVIVVIVVSRLVDVAVVARRKRVLIEVAH